MAFHLALQFLSLTNLTPVLILFKFSVEIKLKAVQLENISSFCIT